MADDIFIIYSSNFSVMYFHYNLNRITTSCHSFFLSITKSSAYG